MLYSTNMAIRNTTYRLFQFILVLTIFNLASMLLIESKYNLFVLTGALILASLFVILCLKIWLYYSYFKAYTDQVEIVNLAIHELKEQHVDKFKLALYDLSIYIQNLNTAGKTYIDNYHFWNLIHEIKHFESVAERLRIKDYMFINGQYRKLFAAALTYKSYSMILNQKEIDSLQLANLRSFTSYIESMIDSGADRKEDFFNNVETFVNLKINLIVGKNFYMDFVKSVDSGILNQLKIKLFY